MTTKLAESLPPSAKSAPEVSADSHTLPPLPSFDWEARLQELEPPSPGQAPNPSSDAS